MGSRTFSRIAVRVLALAASVLLLSGCSDGANIPTGNTEFQFRAGNLNFASTSYDWLVVSQGGSRAQYKGYGTINGQAGYGFLLTALDETPDKFRIKIWSTSTNAVVYDNRMGDADSGDTGTVLGGGSIIIHVPKK